MEVNRFCGKIVDIPKLFTTICTADGVDGVPPVLEGLEPTPAPSDSDLEPVLGPDPAASPPFPACANRERGFQLSIVTFHSSQLNGSLIDEPSLSSA